MHVVFSRIKWQNIELNLVQKEYSYRARGPPPKPTPTLSRAESAGRRRRRALGEPSSLLDSFTPLCHGDIYKHLNSSLPPRCGTFHMYLLVFCGLLMFLAQSLFIHISIKAIGL